MTSAAIIQGLTRELFTHIRPSRRERARPLFAAIEDQWTAVIAYAESQTYRRGVQEGTPTKSAEDVGFEKGCRAGYEAAFNQVMGQVGSPAKRADDEDDGLVPRC